MSVKRGAASRNLDLMWRRPGKPCAIDWQATGNCVPVGTRNGLVVGATLCTQGGSRIFYVRGRQAIKKNTTMQSGNYDRCQARLANKRYAVSKLRCSMPTRASDIRGRRALGAPRERHCRSTDVMKKRRRVKNYRPRVTTRASAPFQKNAWLELESLSGDLFARTSPTPSREYYPLGRSESRLRSGVPGRRSQGSPVGSAQQKSHKRKLLPDAPDGPATYGYQRSERSFCQTGLDA